MYIIYINIYINVAMPTKNVAMFGEKEIIELSRHFEVLLPNGK